MINAPAAPRPNKANVDGSGVGATVKDEASEKVWLTSRLSIVSVGAAVEEP
jgi:hypothetical protein